MTYLGSPGEIAELSDPGCPGSPEVGSTDGNAFSAKPMKKIRLLECWRRPDLSFLSSACAAVSPEVSRRGFIVPVPGIGAVITVCPVWFWKRKSSVAWCQIYTPDGGLECAARTVRSDPIRQSVEWLGWSHWVRGDIRTLEKRVLP